MGAKPLRTLQSQKDAWLAKASATGGKRNELCRVPKKRSHVLPKARFNKMGIDTPGLYPGTDGTPYLFYFVRDETGFARHHRYDREEFLQQLKNKGIDYER